MGRLRADPQAVAILTNHPEFVVETPPPEFLASPCFLEIGMGKGEFLLQMAQNHPEANYIGLEKFPTVLLKALRKWANDPLPNLKMIAGDAHELTTIFPPHSVQEIFLNFSDPWPKARHAKRRLLHPLFLAIYQAILVPGGTIQFRTDNDRFFRWFLDDIAPDAPLELLETNDDLPPTPPMTEYERKFRERGVPIKQVKFRFKK